MSATSTPLATSVTTLGRKSPIRSISGPPSADDSAAPKASAVPISLVLAPFAIVSNVT